MKRPNYLLVLLFPLLFIACTGNEKTEQEKETTLIKNASSVVIKSFSNLTKLDTFRLNLSGTKPKEMTLTFSITNYKGQEIYSKVLKGEELLGSTDPNVDLRKEKDQIRFLTTIASQFFNEDNFLEPAVMPDDKPDSYAPDKAFYDELKATKLNGFKYRLGKENNIYIAWSEKEQKVKVYYNCC
ncbi:hypothetical protein ABIB40_003194 [Pedobacter sp. UYP30]|uniref:hypothetical protein n=1 Tax=Pedobacter sp. UYP30 TaxID=1756400 RepID=UPI003397A9C7